MKTIFYYYKGLVELRVIDHVKAPPKSLIYLNSKQGDKEYEQKPSVAINVKTSKTLLAIREKCTLLFRRYCSLLKDGTKVHDTQQDQIWMVWMDVVSIIWQN